MRRPVALVLTAALSLCTLAPAVAFAHEGNPNFRSIVDSVQPTTPGLKLDVLQLDDRLQLTNRSGKDVTVYGYNDEPYAEVMANGTVRVNTNSPADYLNDDRYGEAPIPKGVTGKGTPRWKTIDKTGVFEWHDHRIHYMAKGTPPQVKDTGVRTKVFDWKVPVAVGATKGDIAGQLFWVPKDSSGPPVAAIAGLVVLLVLGVGTVVIVRRRRGELEDDGDDVAPTEAW